MRAILEKVARHLIPRFDQFAELERLAFLRDLVGCLYDLPLLLVGLGWLVAITNLSESPLKEFLIRPDMAIFLLFAIILSRLNFFQVTGDRAGHYSLNSANLLGIVVIAAVLSWGAWGIWLHLTGLFTEHYIGWRRITTLKQKWNFWRNLLFNAGADPLKLLLFLTIYQTLGGQIPLTNLTSYLVWPALVAILLYIPLGSLIFSPMLILWHWFNLAPPHVAPNLLTRWSRLFTFWTMAETPALFGILATVTYQQMGLTAYIFLMTGMVLMAFLARQLSQYAVTSQQHSRELTELEQFSRHLLAAPADASTLPDILTTHFPRMFEYYHAEIRLTNEQILLHVPLDHPLLPAPMWHWFLVEQQGRPHFITPHDLMPWSGEAAPQTIIMLPILSNQTRELLGGICLLRETNWFMDIASNSRPILQNLADQIASALHSAELYAQSLIHEKMAQELAFAGQIQASFLPTSLPHITGWQLAAMLKPAHETSGDFYDVLLLPNGHIGLIMADVADKGLGAALFMAMSRTLLRTYAFVYPDRPDLVLLYANQRILTDSHTKLFVTVFYGVLNPHNGELIFANAGHVPPYLIRADPSDETVALRNTGMPLGVFETATWEMQAIKLEAGDSLILYTDGLTEASNSEDEFFSASRLLAVARASSHESATILQEHILLAAADFTDGYSQTDDLTLMVLKHAP